MARGATPFGGSAYDAGDSLSPVIRSLILANVVIFLVVLIADRLGAGHALLQLFGLVPTNFWHGMVWQPLTYLFLHEGIMHILFNMLCLWWFGQGVAAQWGSRAFLVYYLICGVGAGLCVAVAGFGSAIPTIGASGAVFGLLLAFAILFPDREVLFMFLFPMKAKYFAGIICLIEVLILLQSGSGAGGVSQIAHLGGAVIGYGYLRYEYGMRMWWHERDDRRRRRREEDVLRREGEWRSFVAEELDPILDKINREGIHTLTEEEKKVLRRAKGRSPRNPD